MSLPCIKVVFLTVYIQLPFLCSAQFGDLKHEQLFLRHLRQQKLYPERLYLLNHLSSPRHTNQLNLEKSWIFYALGRYDSALTFYNQVPLDTVFQYRFHNNFLGLLFKYRYAEQLNKIDSICNTYHKDTTLQNIRLAVNAMQLRYPIKTLESAGLPDPVFIGYSKYYKIKRKSGVVAFTCSLVIPGMGKFYYGQWRSGLNMLIANAVLGIQAHEAYRKTGPSSGQFIIFGSLFSVFYLSNLYGTVIGLKKAKRDQKKQLHNEITDYYFNDADVYPGKF